MEAVYWLHNDHLGTPQALTDVSGRKVWEMSQTPFGIATINEDPDGDGIKVTNNFRFPGQYFDAETGLNYNYQRTYDPMLGRYTQNDPIGLNGGMNPFGYVGGNPISWIDLFGLRQYSSSAEASAMATAEAMGQIPGQYPDNPEDLRNLAAITGVGAVFAYETIGVLTLSTITLHLMANDQYGVALDLLGVYTGIIGHGLGMADNVASWFAFWTTQITGSIDPQNEVGKECP